MTQERNSLMNECPEISKQQLKSIETKGRIFRAAKEILKHEGYEALSIKNICTKANVSNGSFYHHFKTKDDLLSYYIEEQPSIDPELLKLPKDKETVKAVIVRIYLNYAKYCEELGVEFISSYYTPKNQSLNPETWASRSYPIVIVTDYLQNALNHNIIHLKYSLDEVTTDIRLIMTGNIFEWSLKNGTIDIQKNIRRNLESYLNGIFL